MSETIWRATDLNGACWHWNKQPTLDGNEFNANADCMAYYGPEKPPPGECWEYTLTRKGDIDTDGDPIGWKIVGIGKDGSVLCEKGNGQRRRYLFGDWAKEQLSGEAWERLTKERDEALRELANERARIGQVIAERDRTIEELRAKIERPEMPECVRELLEWAKSEDLNEPAKQIAAVEAHYAPPFRIDKLGVYATENGNPWEVIYIDPKGGVVARHETTKLLENFHVSGSCKGGNFSLTKYLRPLE